MPDPADLYELDADLPELDAPVLLNLLPGFVDAGSAGRLLTRHLLGTLTHRPLATFDVDDLIDHRSSRPIMTFVQDHWEAYSGHELVLHLAQDEADTPFLMLTGPEPDYRWERFVSAVIGLIERFGVRLTVGINAIPMAAPHTRPSGMTAHGTRPELVVGYEPWIARVQVPGSVSALLEYRLGRQDRDAVGFAAHVPHYVAQAEYPDSSLSLLNALSRASGLVLPTLALSEAAQATRENIDEQVGKSEEIVAVVEALEQQYDAFLGGRGQAPLLAMDGTAMPTADELGAELERFLAAQDRKEG
ncbi:MAG: PAC2 family protein [Geodermatophilaceae bacterium]|nr:PAC2 family protein [Geodermatophilaceae bacterium]